MDLFRLLMYRNYVDNESLRLYEVTEVRYDDEYRRVVGFRRVLDGNKADKFDDYPFDMYGEHGIIQLVGEYEVDNPLGKVRWPLNAEPHRN